MNEKKSIGETLGISELKSINNFTPDSLTGMLLPWIEQQPVMFRPPGETEHFIAVFGSEEQLRDAMTRSGFTEDQYTIKQVEDGLEFATTIINKGLRIAANLRYNPETGKSNWTDLRSFS